MKSRKDFLNRGKKATMISKGRGWHGESARHRLAARGYCTVKKETAKVDRTYWRKWRELEAILLAIGGRTLGAIRDEPDLDDILKRGKLIKNPHATFIRGESNACHANAGFLFEQSPEDTRVMTGYALTGGQWVQHSWAYDIEANFVIETTIPRDKYFGFLMTKQESQKFADENEAQAFPDPWEEDYD